MLTNEERLTIALALRERAEHKRQRIPPLSRQTPPSPKDILRELEAVAEQSYDQLDGEWHDWFEVARRYEGKVPYQDRLDIRHTILIELHRARQRDGEPIPTLRAYRIASLTVALYWRQQLRYQVRVCVFDWIAKEPLCKSCIHKPKKGRCPYLAIRPIQSLDSGEGLALLETVADDKAIDQVAKLDAEAFLLGCPMRLIEIATKKLEGKALTDKDRMYLMRYRRQTQKRLL